jgi:Arc/MetJ-type ribon-helix-helix transcriptional regulator
MPARRDKVTIKIPRPLYNRLRQLIEGSGYDSVTDFVVYVLRDLVSTHAAEEREELTPEDLKRVKERLRGLGYL